jgi:aryl-alcohol dehydrogenase-like predicted oxidoreductase
MLTNRHRCATPEGTARYAERLSAATAKGHFREQRGLYMSSIGLGTALGDCDDETDEMYRQSIVRAYELGVNVIDSAINYRFQRSERAIGTALRQLFASGKAERDEVIVATKGGSIPFDEDEPERDAAGWITENIIDKGLAQPDEVIGARHCLSPAYLESQLSSSLENLGLDCIDIYYVHNPEIQLEAVARAEFHRRVRAAFEVLEGAAADGRIQFYGTATWSGYREPPDAQQYLSLAEMVALAREVGGERHHLRAVQLPCNLAMPEAVTMQNQSVDGEAMSALMAAARLGVTVICSASIRQGQLAQNLPHLIAGLFGGLDTDAQRAIQFVRSTPGVTTALVGMSRRAHVEENLRVAQTPPISLEDSFGMYHE